MAEQTKKPNMLKRMIVSLMIGLGNGMGMLGKDPKKQDSNDSPFSRDIDPEKDEDGRS